MGVSWGFGKKAGGTGLDDVLGGVGVLEGEEGVGGDGGVGCGAGECGDGEDEVGGGAGGGDEVGGGLDEGGVCDDVCDEGGVAVGWEGVGEGEGLVWGGDVDLVVGEV